MPRIMSSRCQFSLRALMSLVAAVSISLAAVLQVPHWFVFGLSSIWLLLASLAPFRVKSNPRLRFRLFAAAVPAWLCFYVLSFGPFIALSEFDRKISGQHHVARLAPAYLPAMRLNRFEAFRWYASRWIPADAAGLHELHNGRLPRELVGTWQTDTAMLVNLRADGTGRAIALSGEFKPKVIYFEWTLNTNELAIYQFGSKQSPFAWFGRAAMNYAPTDKFDLIEPSQSKFKLREIKAGRIVSLTRTQDAQLESVH
jgi:hypothetical protein